MYEDFIDVIVKDSKCPGFLNRLSGSVAGDDVVGARNKNAGVKKEYENLKRQLENLTKDHLSFFETFQGNFKKQEQCLKEIKDLSDKIEDEIVATKSRILEKQEKISTLQTRLAEDKLALEYKGRLISTYKNYTLSWPVLFAIFACTFLLISYQNVAERVVY